MMKEVRRRRPDAMMSHMVKEAEGGAWRLGAASTSCLNITGYYITGGAGEEAGLDFKIFLDVVFSSNWSPNTNKNI